MKLKKDIKRKKANFKKPNQLQKFITLYLKWWIAKFWGKLHDSEQNQCYFSFFIAIMWVIICSVGIANKSLKDTLTFPLFGRFHLNRNNHKQKTLSVDFKFCNKKNPFDIFWEFFLFVSPYAKKGVPEAEWISIGFFQWQQSQQCWKLCFVSSKCWKASLRFTATVYML